MKRTIQTIVLLVAFAQVASAQETYSVVLNNALKVAQLDLGRAQQNDAVCARLNISASCTQANACVAANVVGGASCAVVDAVAAGVRIYPVNLSGREGFLTNELVKASLPGFVEKNAQKAMATFRASCLAADQAQKNAICTGIGQSAGCGICDSFQ